MVAYSSIPRDEDMNEDITSSSTYRYYYSVLNIPKDADIAHIQRNYKLLSRIYHPDKATATGMMSSNHRDVAQQSFVIIKTAVDVLCDPIYRWVYDYGDEIAVTLVKRSQSARHSEQQQQQQHNSDTSKNKNNNTDDENNNTNDPHRQDEKSNNRSPADDDDNDDDDDLYMMLHNKLRQNRIEEAISIVQEVLENYYTQQQNQMNHIHTSKFDLSCSIPMTWKESDRYYYNNTTSTSMYRLQKESISLNAQGRYPINSHLGISLGAGSDVYRQKPKSNSKDENETNYNQSRQKNSIKGSLGFDVQPIQGTNIYGNVTANPNRITYPDISMSTSRKWSNDSIVVAAIHGTVQNSKSWYTSFISSKPILHETIFGKSFGSTTGNSSNKKLMMNWRIICDMVGRLRGLMMSLRNMEYPMWNCRLSLSNYPLKLSWCGSETDTFYVAVSFGIMEWPRIKVVRISSFGSRDRDDQQQQWKVKYGLKHDPQQAMLGSSLWSVVCTIQYANEFTLRIPIRLLESSTTPVTWIGSILIAEFVDQQLKHIQWNDDNNNKNNNVDFRPMLRYNNSNQRRCLPKVALDTFRNVTNKKRIDESNQPNGLVILHAKATCHTINSVYDITDTLQFWVVNSQLNMSITDVRLLWQIDDIALKQDTREDVEASWWWWNMKSKPNESETTEYISSLEVRYQYKGMTYQITFDASTTIQLPNINAVELGMSNRVR